MSFEKKAYVSQLFIINRSIWLVIEVIQKFSELLQNKLSDSLTIYFTQTQIMGN